MAVVTITLAAGSTASTPVKLPMSYQNWQGVGASCLLNFSGGGPATGNVTLQVSNDPNAGPQNSGNATARWNSHDIIVNRTADTNSSIVYPVAYARLTGTVTSGNATCQIGIPDTSTPTV